MPRRALQQASGRRAGWPIAQPRVPRAAFVFLVLFSAHGSIVFLVLSPARPDAVSCPLYDCIFSLRAVLLLQRAGRHASTFFPSSLVRAADRERRGAETWVCLVPPPSLPAQTTREE